MRGAPPPATAAASVRILPAPLPPAALDWMAPAEGAVALLVRTAPGALRCDPAPDAPARLAAAAGRALEAGCTRVLAWLAEGDVDEGGCTAIAACAAAQPTVASRCAQRLLAALDAAAERAPGGGQDLAVEASTPPRQQADAPLRQQADPPPRQHARR